MPGLLGKKIGMTSVFSADGKNVPCTVIEAGPCVVTQIKSVEKDGYAAVQVGFQDKKEKHTTKPLMGHFKKAGVTPKRHLAEFKDFETELNLGDTITVHPSENGGNSCNRPIQERRFIGDVCSVVQRQYPVAAFQHRVCHNCFARFPFRVKNSFSQKGDYYKCA